MGIAQLWTRGNALKTSERRRMGKIWINLAHSRTKSLSAQPVTTERYPYLDDTKPVNHSTKTSRFTWEEIPLKPQWCCFNKWHCLLRYKILLCNLHIEFNLKIAFPWIPSRLVLFLDLSSLLTVRIARLESEQEKKEMQIVEIAREEKEKWVLIRS